MTAPAPLPTTSWFDEVRLARPDVLAVAEAVGLRVVRRRFGPCPACGRAEPRHPPLTVRHEGRGWMCAGCKETGDVVALVSWVVTGTKRPATGDGWAAVRAAFASKGWCSADERQRGAWTPPTPKPAPPPLPYPDEREVLDLLRVCRPVATVPEVAGWCRDKFKIDADAVSRLPAAVLPDVYRWPRWWSPKWRPWRLVVSMVDNTGTIRSIHARATEDVGDMGKTRWPYERRADGLLFADPRVARPMLRGKAEPRVVVVCEGITDYLAAAVRARPDTAVLSACSGGFGALAGAKIPRSAVVYAWTDPSVSGDRYAAEIVAALKGRDVRRVDLRRMR